MKQFTHDELRLALRQLDPIELRHFLADLWAASGWETTVTDEFISASWPNPGHDERMMVVASPPGILTGATIPAHATDVDAVIVPGPARGRDVRNFEGQVHDIDALYDRLYYSIDRKEASSLISRYFGPVDQSPVNWLTRVRDSLTELTWRARAAPIQALMVISLVLLLGVGATATGVWLGVGSSGSPIPVQSTETVENTPDTGPIAATPATNGSDVSALSTLTPSLDEIPLQPANPQTGDWRMFQFDTHRSGWNRFTSGPRTGGEIVASQDLPAPVLSSPAIVGNRLYIGTQDGEVLILDTDSLRVLRNVSVAEQIYNSPAISHGQVFIGTSDNQFTRSELNKSVSAINVTSGNVSHLSRSVEVSFSSPAVRNETVYVGATDGRVYAFNIRSGSLRWATEIGRTVFASPSINQNTVYAAASDGTIVGLNATSGAKRWTYSANSTIVSTPTFRQGTVYTGTLGQYLYAINTTTGELEWKRSVPGQIFASPALDQDTLYVGTTEDTFLAINATSGAVRWNQSVASSIESSPAITNLTVYAATKAGIITAFDKSSGRQLWLIERSGSIFSSSPIVVNGRVYIVDSSGELLAIEEPN